MNTNDQNTVSALLEQRTFTEGRYYTESLVSLCLIGHFIQAIKMVRRDLSLSLKEAKDIVDTLRNDMGRIMSDFNVPYGQKIDEIHKCFMVLVLPALVNSHAILVCENRALKAQVNQMADDAHDAANARRQFA